MLPTTDRSRAIEKWAQVSAISLVLFYAATSLYISTHRWFWYDEVSTALTIRMPGWKALWGALVEDNFDPSPLGYIFIARTFDQLFHRAEVGIRLPSLLAVAAGMLLTYDCARRLSNNLHGLLAMVLLTCSLLPYYAYEGRSYGIYFFLTALALWLWMREKPTFAMAVVFFVGLTIHYYMVLGLVPFMADDLLRWWRGERLRRTWIAGLAGAVLAIALQAPQVIASKKNYSAFFWAKPSLVKVPEVITGLFPAGMLLLAAAAIWIAMMDRGRAVWSAPMADGERVSWLFLLIPFAAFVMAKLVTNAYTSRYLINVLPGAVVAISCLLYRRFREAPLISIGVLVLCLGQGLITQVLATTKADRIFAFTRSQGLAEVMLQMEDRLWADGKRYIVITDGDLLYLPAIYYSHHPERYIIQSEFYSRQPHYYPFVIWGHAELKQHYREAAFIEPRHEALEVMRQEGVRTFLKYPGMLNVFYME